MLASPVVSRRAAALRRLALPALAALLFAAPAAPAARAQTLDPAFNPSPDLDVLALAAQRDGRLLVGGTFGTIAGATRARLARLHPDGTLDAAFNPAPNSDIQEIVVLPDGKIYVAGGFTALGPVPAVRLARLHPDGSPDTTFSAGADRTVRVLAVQPDGKLLLGGSFAAVNNTPRTLLARLNPDGSLDPAFNPVFAGLNVSSGGADQARVDALVLQPDGKILVGGTFAQVSGQPRAGLARLLPDGTLDSTFTVGSGANSNVLCLALQPDGRILVGGSFNLFAGQIRNNLARLSATGALDSQVGLTGTASGIGTLVLLPDGRFYAGGTFTAVGSLPRTRLARFNADGSFDPAFNLEISGNSGPSTPGLYAMIVPGPDQLLFGGSFSTVGGQPRLGLARLGTPLPVLTRQPVSVAALADQTVAFTVATSAENPAYQWRRNGTALPGATAATLTLPALSAAVAGTYTVAVTNAFGTTASDPATLTLAALTAPAATYTVATFAGAAGSAGSVDGPGATARFDRPSGLALDPAGHVYVADVSANFIRKITPDGTVSTFATQAAVALALDPAGRLYVADGRSRLVRLAPDGTSTPFAGTSTPGRADGPALTAQFDAPAGVAVDVSGEVYVADTGNRTLRRIAADGTVSTFAGRAGETGSVDGPAATARFTAPRGLAFDAAGRLLVADGNAIRRVARDGTVSTLAPATAAYGIAVDAAGSIFVADANLHVVRRLAPDGTDTVIAGASGTRGTADGPGASARFAAPWGLAVDAAGRLTVADNANSTVRRLTPATAPFAITVPPVATHSAAAASVVLGVAAAGSPLAFQWKKAGVPVPGATAATLHLASANADAHMGAYTVAVTSAGTTVESAPVLLTVANPAAPGRLINVATRGLVPAGEALTPGFVLRGTGEKQLLVRGVGPTLARFGIGDHIPDPRLEVALLGGATVASNQDWASADSALTAATTAAGAFPLDPASKDAALLATLASPSGVAAYTARLTGTTATESGVALAEVYDRSPLDSPVALANVSTRGFVGTGSAALVPGFVIGGRGPLQLLIRAVGPGLAPFGVTGLLADPQLVVTPLGQSTPVAANDNWGNAPALAAAFAAAGAFALPADSKDAAVLVRLPPGAYTVTVTGAAATTGTALVEIYDLP
jgi:uncharacterized delta-60 repeat protein